MGTRFDSKTCEPFRAWNRLEPRTRKREFEQAISAEVHDPLWMLARQWQFGEFKGEDTGSAIFAKIQIERTKLKKYQEGALNTTPAILMDEKVPLEKTVESMPIRLGYKGRIRAGQHFFKLLSHYLKGLSGFSQTLYEEKLSLKYRIEGIQWNDADSDVLKIQKAKLLANHNLVHFLKVFEGKAADGLELYQDLKTNQATTVEEIIINSSHKPQLLAAVADYISWFEECFDAVPKQQNNSWNSSQMEYQFACSFPEKNSPATVLVADEYYTGHLDWFSFDVEKELDPASPLLSHINSAEDVKVETFSFIPTEASFAGMPNSRWWQFEDGKVDLGNISAETTDVAKLVVAEYALVYGNDWFVVPYRLPVGSLSKINGLLVTDVFGQKTLVEAAVQGETDDWASWGLFNLSVKFQNSGAIPKSDTRLFLPPALFKTHESDEVEEVLFLRDEMANMVWGIENKVNSLLDFGIDGHSLGNENRKILHGETKPPLEADEAALLKYSLSNEVPENWIPFIPVHIPGQNRAIRLQRASIPRELEGNFTPIRPRTDLLRDGFPKKPEEAEPYISLETDLQQKAYFINEEEIPRSGIKVTGKYQRSRWFDGAIIKWYGYQKHIGRGEGSSGLQFDRMELLKKNKPEKVNENL